MTGLGSRETHWSSMASAMARLWRAATASSTCARTGLPRRGRRSQRAWMPVSLDLPGARRFMATDAAVESRSVGVGRCGRPPCVPGTSTDGRCERSDPGPRGGAHPLAGTARARLRRARCRPVHDRELPGCRGARVRSEEHTSELQSRFDLVCRLLLEKKKKINFSYDISLRRLLARTGVVLLVYS